MNSTFYLPRKLLDGNRYYDESELLAASQYIVVLAEPGAGKSRLLESFAHRLNTRQITANTFLYSNSNNCNLPKVIDGFDELARIDSSGIHKLLGKLSGIQPSVVLISSRSSEWDEACTVAFRDFFGKNPLVVRISQFNQEEQRQLFENHAPTENFKTFITEVTRFGLEPLLPNPQFLKLFADAYIESDRRFRDKKSIFRLAIERLAKESNQSIASRSILPYELKVELSEEVFAKLLLSGAEGVSLTDINADRLFPILGSLSTNERMESLLSSQLFKPGDKADQHYPVHRIVMEYCAANYLVKRLTANTHHLSFSQCLSIIAPSSIVRDELRGLLGWMAALGNKPIQERLIDLDPYAILANGDPSQLLPSSKKRLLHKLREVAKEDPYFRRSDIWRTFSVAGFFTGDFVEDLKSLLMEDDQESHLRGLLLELLVGSHVIPHIVEELQQLVLSRDNDKHIRVLANECLLDFPECNDKSILDALIEEADSSSLSIVASIIEKFGTTSFEPSFISTFLRSCTKLYPDQNAQFYNVIGERYFIKNLILNFDLALVEWLLDDLTHGLSCACGKEQYECYCRNGISKIIGSLLDRFFELSVAPFDSQKIWIWIQNLNFHAGKRIEDSLSVRVLQENDALRQSIIRLAFEEVTDEDQIHKINIEKFSSDTHSGLHFKFQDYFFISEMAFELDNLELWSYFIKLHQYHDRRRNTDFYLLRRHMKLQARNKPEFFLEWVKRNRRAKEFFIEHKRKWMHPTQRRQKLEHERDALRRANIRYVHENRELVEGGKHWTCLISFSDLVLSRPQDIEKEFGDKQLVRNALRNCLDFIEPHVPSLQELAELQCESKFNQSELILHAACLEIYREKGNLDGVKYHLLEALRTNWNMHYSTLPDEERKALKAEVNRLLFPTIEAAESFLRSYLEPQLSIKGCRHPQVGWLRYDEVFKPLQSSLALEWLYKYPEMALDATKTLFDLAAQFGDRQELERLIRINGEKLVKLCPDITDNDELERKKSFWFLRAFYFLPSELVSAYWNWLKVDKDTVFLLEISMEGMRHGDHPYWPTLSSIKIGNILDSFIDQWPKVDLPSSWGTSSPAGETAYRFLKNIVWTIGKNDPDESLPVIDRLLKDQRLVDFYLSLKSIRSTLIRKKALSDFEAPEPRQIVEFLDHNGIATVEGLRAVLLEELEIYQNDLNGSETTTKGIFYNSIAGGTSERLGEVDAALRIADRLRLRLEPRGITITPEHQMQDANRCDITCSKVIDSHRRLLVIEAKGQWHKELYTAASKQLSERYSIHPHAEQQGIYLVLWFGEYEKVANRKNKTIKNAQQLRESIKLTIPIELKGLIDVFVLDVSKS